MAYEIKRLSIDDHERVVELWAIGGLPFKPKGRDSKELMAIELQRNDCRMFGLFDGSNIIGVVIANFDGRRGWINRLAIDPDYRGQKLAGQLIEKSEEFLYSIGAKVICALIDDENLPSISTFQHSGYKLEDGLLYFAKRPDYET